MVVWLCVVPPAGVLRCVFTISLSSTFCFVSVCVVVFFFSLFLSGFSGFFAGGSEQKEKKKRLWVVAVGAC